MAIMEQRQSTNGIALQAPPSGLIRLQHLIVNSYLVGEPGAGTWAVVDAGLAPTSASAIFQAAEHHFGIGAKPALIVLTHGHFDHVGGLKQLLRRWDVPVYAHELELPYLTGRSAYPPPDPTVGGGLIARLSGLFPRGPINLGDRVRALPADGVVPEMPGWRWLHTPGHSPGHISLFRMSDRTLIAGDAFVTVKQESLLSIISQRPQVSRPPAYYTPDWPSAKRSVESLAALEPEYAATGHGVPVQGEQLRLALRELVLDFDRLAVPTRGRYVRRPAMTDETGVVLIPPAVPDPVSKVAGVGLAILTLMSIVAATRGPKRRERRAERRRRERSM